ncbi:hypothetical protein LBMAG37_16710 [Anaerolineae bacterium]|nr:hypothetical protein LBMAG37_16710 [Anaerolineae bacterium]
MLVLAACAPAAPPPAPTDVPAPAAAEVAAPAAYKACVAFDTGGLGDKGFNDLAMKGLDDAKALGYDTAFAEAQGATDYAGNIQRLIDEGCQTIVTVGFTQGEATVAATLANPEINFGQVDATWPEAGADFTPGTADDLPFPPNFTGLDFQIDQASMLAGYLAAGFSKTGKIGTYGGAQFPGVTRFMDGMYAGIKYYNEKNKAKVKLLGWDAAKQTGTFVGGDNPWGDPAKGEQLAQTFMDQGADIVHPVAGGTGNGTIKAMLAAGKYAIGVDTDQAVSLPDYTGALMTSAQKAIDVAVSDLIKKNDGGDTGGENYIGTLDNGGVALAPFHDFEGKFAADLVAAVDALKADIASGKVKVSDYMTATAYKACVAFDTGGLGDKGFNDLAMKGLDDAKALGYDTAFAEAQGATDYAGNIQRLIDEGCQTIVTVGFTQGEATVAATLANPEINFGQVDATWPEAGADFTPGTADDLPFPPNFTGLDFQIDQASMLAGYLAAGFSKTGKIGTYGGAQFPGVTRFMDGMYAGIKYYNEKNKAKVKLLGWDAAKQTGTFVGGDNPWGDPAKGEQLAQTFMDQGADIVHPVAGGTGNGTIKAMLAAGKYAIGVDTDQAVSLPDYTGALMTSAQKAIDVAVSDLIKKNDGGDTGGENYIGTLDNGGVALAPFHDFEGKFAADLVAAVDALKADISSGKVKVADYLK